MSSQLSPENTRLGNNGPSSTMLDRDDDGSQSPHEVHSRTKQQSIDDESDDELPQITRRRGPISFSPSPNALHDSRASSVPESDGDSSDVEVSRPRGRLASRLNAQSRQQPGEQKHNGSSAYERIKQQLLGEPMSPRANEPEQTPELQEPQEQKSPVVPPTRITRKFLRRKRTKLVESEDGRSTSEIRPAEDRRSHTLESRRSSSEANSPIAPIPTSPKATAEAKSAIALDDSDSFPENPLQNARFLALVARKREERKAREAQEERKLKEREARYMSSRPTPSNISDIESNEDIAAGRELTQHSKPTRKASKKALEEINRETQRISRNMQLAHEAKTKKKITKDSFLDRFNFRLNGPSSANIKGPNDTNQSSSTVVSSLPGSDVERSNEHQTPPTSPERLDGPANAPKLVSTVEPTIAANFEVDDDDFPSFGDMLDNHSKDKGKGKAIEEAPAAPLELEDEFPTFAEILHTQSKDKGKGKAVEVPPKDKGKGKAFEEPLPEKPKNWPVFTQRPIKIKPPANPVLPEGYAYDSDSDLEIVPTKRSSSHKLDVFDRIPAKKASDNQTRLKLRTLAHLGSPSRRGPASKPSMNPTELQDSLRKRARQQAARERAERLQELKDRGIIIQTAEERARDQETVEDMLERARREDEELTKQEKEAAKKEKRENGEDDALESSEDEDYQEGEDEPEVELSGSEEDDENNGDDEEEEDVGDEVDADEAGAKSMIDNEASEDDEEESEEDRPAPNDEIDAGSGSEDDGNVTQVGRRGKRNQVVDDDENDSDTVNQPEPSQPKSSPSPTGTQPIQNPFGQVAMGSGGHSMGLTQAFASTMVDTQTAEFPADDEQDSLDALKNMSLPDFSPPQPDTLVADSQVGEGPDIDLHFTQSQIVQDSYNLDRPTTATQHSQIPDPTQDVGFGKSSPVKSRFAPIPPSTVDTVILPPGSEVQPFKKKGRLRRRVEAVTVFSDEDNVSPNEEAGFEISANAFDVMKKAVKTKMQDEFVKEKSGAKGMVEEQAEESEDEYAGLGGASDDGSEGEEDEEVQKMIDEEDVEVDERKMAAFYA